MLLRYLAKIIWLIIPKNILVRLTFFLKKIQKVGVGKSQILFVAKREKLWWNGSNLLQNGEKRSTMDHEGHEWIHTGNV